MYSFMKESVLNSDVLFQTNGRRARGEEAVAAPLLASSCNQATSGDELADYLEATQQEGASNVYVIQCLSP